MQATTSRLFGCVLFGQDVDTFECIPPASNVFHPLDTIEYIPLDWIPLEVVACISTQFECIPPTRYYGMNSTIEWIPLLNKFHWMLLLAFHPPTHTHIHMHPHACKHTLTRHWGHSFWPRRRYFWMHSAQKRCKHVLNVWHFRCKFQCMSSIKRRYLQWIYSAQKWCKHVLNVWHSRCEFQCMSSIKRRYLWMHSAQKRCRQVLNAANFSVCP